MIKVDVTLSNDTLLQLQSQLEMFGGKNGKNIMPATTNAFNLASKLIQKSWQNWAMGGSVEGAENIKNPNSKLASSIKIQRLNDFNAEIGTDSPYMERIESGQVAFDMKTKYPYGAKSRVSRKEKIPYLIIPFRWGTPNKNGGERAHFGNTIPQVAYEIIKSKNFKKSSQTDEIKIEKNFRGEDVKRHTYNWGDRLNDDDLGNAAGMVKMAEDTNHGKGRSGSTYFTFRIISAKSPSGSWIRKEVPPNKVIEAIEKTNRSVIEDLINTGLEQDLGL